MSGLTHSTGIPDSGGRSMASDWNDRNISDKLQFLKSKINAAEATAKSVISTNDGVQSPIQANGNQGSPRPSKTVSSLRQRMAAATERSNAKSPDMMQSQQSSPAMGNAAALRDRLETVKRNGNMLQE